MRNLTIPEACLLVGTAVLGGAGFLALEIARLDHHHVTAAQADAKVVQTAVTAPAALAPQGTPPSSPPLAPPPSQAVVSEKKRHDPKTERARTKRPLPALDAECERSDDPLCGAL